MIEEYDAETNLLIKISLFNVRLEYSISVDGLRNTIHMIFNKKEQTLKSTKVVEMMCGLRDIKNQTHLQKVSSLVDKIDNHNFNIKMKNMELKELL